ncbi:MAG TPA: hypothetical protein PL110_12385 [Candidatus Eremiobacteraeota bacterium]|nr:hypothetical protein [Candidatus Eremiobacteraeota bacterium]
MTDAQLISQINNDFHKILEKMDTPDHPAKDILARANKDFHERGCVINVGKGDDVKMQPFPVFIMPYFITRAEMNEIARVSNHILNVLEKVSNLYFLDDKYKPMFNLTDKETELMESETGTQRRVWITRNDAFQEGDVLKFIEFNTDSPGGPMYSDVQTEIIEQSVVMDELRKKYYMSSDRFVPQILYNLLKAYREWGGKKRMPNIAIVSDKGATYPEFLIIVDDFKRQGYNCEFATPPQLEYRNGKAYTPGGMEIDILYRRGWIRNWTDYWDEIKPLRQAYRENAFCCVNSIRSLLASIKSILEHIQDKEIAKLYTKEEYEVVFKNIPWTRLMKNRKTLAPDGKTEVDLFDYVQKNRESLVLKPIDLYGGQNVCVGPANTQEDWEKTINLAATTDQKYVVQHYVKIPEMDLPEVDPELVWKPKKLNQNFYAFGGQHVGGMCRTSESHVINISAGGGLCPIIIVEGMK